MTLTVRNIAHARAGDKGERVNVSVIAYDSAGYERLLRDFITSPEARAVQTIAGQLRTSKREDAERAAHSLKGLPAHSALRHYRQWHKG